jgi:hypothetical protein
MKKSIILAAIGCLILGNAAAAITECSPYIRCKATAKGLLCQTSNQGTIFITQPSVVGQWYLEVTTMVVPGTITCQYKGTDGEAYAPVPLNTQPVPFTGWVGNKCFAPRACQWDTSA